MRINKSRLEASLEHFKHHKWNTYTSNQIATLAWDMGARDFTTTKGKVYETAEAEAFLLALS